MRLIQLLVAAIFAFCSVTFIHAQSPTPEASASPSKHRGHKKAEAKVEASPAATETAASSTAATPAPKKRSHKKAETGAAASPSPATAAASPSASPAAKRSRKKTETAAAVASPAPATTASSPVASPAPKRSRKKTETAATATSPAPAAAPTATPRPSILGGFFKPKPTPVPAAATTAPPVAARTGKSPATNTSNATPMPGGGNGLVWVNTESHIYHKEGTRYYGKTKKGKYMSEADAIKEGDHAAKRE